MKSEITLPNNKIKAEGKIIIEYTNGETGKVENRFESENHAFPGGFLRQNNYWFSNNNSSYTPFCIFLSDEGENINYNIPLIPGNIIGYGYPESNTYSTMQGSENINARSLGVYSDGKWHYKRQWNWLPSQVTSEIKSFGIGPFSIGRDSNSDNSRRNMLPHQIPFNLKGDPSLYGYMSIYENEKSYSFSGSSIDPTNGVNVEVRIQDLKKDYNTDIQIVNLKNLIPIPEDMPTRDYSPASCNIAYFVDLDNYDFIVMFLYQTAEKNPKVQVSRLNSNCTEIKSTVRYECGTYTSNNDYPFSGYSAHTYSSCGYFKNNKFYLMYAEQETCYSLLAEINPSNWNSSGDFMDAFSFNKMPVDEVGYIPRYTGACHFSYKNNYPIFITTSAQEPNSTSVNNKRQIMTIINPENNKPYASKSLMSKVDGSYYYGRPFLEIVDGHNVIIQLLAYNDNCHCIDGENTYYRNLSDYTLYVLPDNAPKREEGQGVTITYEIAWGYEEDN